MKHTLKYKKTKKRLSLVLRNEGLPRLIANYTVWERKSGEKIDRLLYRSERKVRQILKSKRRLFKLPNFGDIKAVSLVLRNEGLRYQKAFSVTSGIFLILVISLYFFLFKDLPNPSSLTTGKIPLTTIIRARDGQILYRVYKNENRVKLAYEEIPQVVKDSTIAIEDADFYKHKGISIKSIARAFIYNLRQKNTNLYQGGSTITQQLVKNTLLSAERTIPRKFKEAILAVWTEMTYSKNEILTFYLNEVGYGGPAYGIEAASQMYFGKSAKGLTLSEAAFLAGLPAAPTTFSPFGVNSHLAAIRQEQVLERMLKLKTITQDAYEKAKSQKLVFAPQRIDILAPHFVMFVKDQLVAQLGEEAAMEGGLDVYTTLDYGVQKQAEEIVKKQIEKLKGPYRIRNGAALVTNPQTGEILAMVGSPDYFDIANEGYVNGTTAKRQPGSSIKPVNYAYAFDHGYTPTTTINDSPVIYVAPGSSETYAPKNYDGKFHGIVTVRSALANSYNIPAVKILNSYGVQKMIDLGKAMGIKSWENIPPVGLSLTLGGAEVNMLDMARAYGTIANLGVRKELKVIKEIRDSNNNTITDSFYQSKNARDLALIGDAKAEENKQVISPLSAWWLTDILSDDVARLPAFGAYAKLTIPNHKVAVKTGTSNNFRDNWTIGFTPDYLTAVWVGNNDGSFMNSNLVSGITGAAPIWNDIMGAVLADTPDKEFPKPENLVAVKVCAVNGLLTCPYCPAEKTEYFTPDKVPTKQCSFRSPDDCNNAKAQAEGKSDDEKKQLLSGCPNGN